ncbi:MAG: Na/Pi symporter [Candidatus Omnitrophota bacterium]
MNKFLSRVIRVAKILILLYFFLVSISLMSHSFKCFGKGFSEQLLTTTSNPVVALFVGLLATSVIQSSSTTTSMVVGFVAGGVLSIHNAIPIIMGANIGTTVTNTIVAVGHVTRKEEFRRAFSSATMHDFFNVLTVLILFPFELCTGYLEKTAGHIASFLEHSGGIKATDPIKVVIKPAVSFCDNVLIGPLHLSEKTAGIVMLVLSFIVLILALIGLVGVMKSIVANRTEIVLDKLLARSGFAALIMGFLFTAIVQSSSVTTSILVPMVGAGVLRVETVYPLILGANLGTTVTALLASLTGNVAAITIALVHILFNLTGVLIFYPFAFMRKIPVAMAKTWSAIVAERRWMAFVYVGIMFFMLPLLLIWIDRLIGLSRR